MTESMDYDSAMITWKLPLKKSFEVKTMEIQEQHNGMPPIISIPSLIPSQDSLQVMHLGQFELMPSQHIHSNISQHGMQSTIQHLDSNKIENNKIQICQNMQILPSLTQQKEQSKPRQIEKLKDKFTKRKVKMRTLPIGNMAYHSKQFGFKVPPKKVIFK